MKKEDIIKQFHNACNLLASTVNAQLFDGCRIWHWVGGEIGGLCNFGNIDYLNPEEMVLIIGKNVTYEQYAEWRDTSLNNLTEKGHINLNSWLKGCRYEMLQTSPKIIADTLKVVNGLVAEYGKNQELADVLQDLNFRLRQCNKSNENCNIN